jgi:hypothetical protein
MVPPAPETVPPIAPWPDDTSPFAQPTAKSSNSAPIAWSAARESESPRADLPSTEGLQWSRPGFFEVCAKEGSLLLAMSPTLPHPGTNVAPAGGHGKGVYDWVKGKMARSA